MKGTKNDMVFLDKVSDLSDVVSFSYRCFECESTMIKMKRNFCGFWTHYRKSSVWLQNPRKKCEKL